MKMPIFTSPLMINDPSPALITAAPAKPPMRAWEELVGRPQYQVMRFQTMAPIKRGKDDRLVDDAGLDDTLSHGRGHADAEAEGRRRS